jgi:nitrate/nitrite transporter NarK
LSLARLESASCCTAAALAQQVQQHTPRQQNLTQTLLHIFPAEHKSLVMCPWYFSKPHFPAFHLSWLAFFAAFVSTFAPAALLPVIRDNLDLTKTDLGNAGIAAVCGAIAARVAMGNFVGEQQLLASLAEHLQVVSCDVSASAKDQSMSHCTAW